MRPIASSLPQDCPLSDSRIPARRRVTPRSPTQDSPLLDDRPPACRGLTLRSPTQDPPLLDDRLPARRRLTARSPTQDSPLIDDRPPVRRRLTLRSPTQDPSLLDDRPPGRRRLALCSPTQDPPLLDAGSFFRPCAPPLPTDRSRATSRPSVSLIRGARAPRDPLVAATGSRGSDWRPWSWSARWWFSGSCIRPHHCWFVTLPCDWPGLAPQKGSTDRGSIERQRERQRHRVPSTGPAARCVSGWHCCGTCVLSRRRSTDWSRSCVLCVVGRSLVVWAPLAGTAPFCSHALSDPVGSSSYSYYQSSF